MSLWVFTVVAVGFFKLGAQTGGPEKFGRFYVCLSFRGWACLVPLMGSPRLGADRRARIIRKILFFFVGSWPSVPCISMVFTVLAVGFYTLGGQTGGPE